MPSTIKEISVNIKKFGSIRSGLEKIIKKV